MSTGRSSPPPLLEMRGITKRFPGTTANDDVDLVLRAGTVHALLGENGAGKTTLMNVLYGLQQPDAGEILLRGEPVRLRSPRDAKAHGIGLVAQHFHLARRHTVAENVALGLPDTPALFPTRALHARITAFAERYGFDLDPRARVGELSPGQQQRVEIVKALLQGAEVLVLDEPTSVLTPQEAERLFEVLETFVAEGKGIVFISHKLEEVRRIADDVTVLRGGRVAGRRRADEATAEELARLMIGRDVPREVDARTGAEPPADDRRTRLRITDLRLRDARGTERLRGVNLEVRAGEIVGVAGVAGNGQRELIEAVTGLARPDAGRVELDGEDVTEKNVRGLFERGVVHIPEDRNDMGVVGSMQVAENLVLRRHRQWPFARGRLLDWGAVGRFASDAIRDYQIAAPSARTDTRLLSGGNVQKVILARELSGGTSLVVASHPTYGLDVAATELTHRLLRERRDDGAAVLLVSEDLDEILRLADRIAVLFDGRVMGVLDAAEADRETLGVLMAGGRRAA